MRFRIVRSGDACHPHNMVPTPIPDEYVLLAKILSEDASLHRGFLALGEAPSNQRYSILGGLAARFRDAGHPDLAALVQALYGEGIYQLVKTVIEALAHE